MVMRGHCDGEIGRVALRLGTVWLSAGARHRFARDCEGKASMGNDLMSLAWQPAMIGAAKVVRGCDVFSGSTVLIRVGRGKQREDDMPSDGFAGL